jgi:hypothetical protein
VKQNVVHKESESRVLAVTSPTSTSTLKLDPDVLAPLNFRSRCSLGPGDLYLSLHRASNLDVGEIEPSFSLIVCVYSIGLSRWNRAK